MTVVCCVCFSLGYGIYPTMNDCARARASILSGYTTDIVAAWCASYISDRGDMLSHHISVHDIP